MIDRNSVKSGSRVTKILSGVGGSRILAGSSGTIGSTAQDVFSVAWDVDKGALLGCVFYSWSLAYGFEVEDISMVVE